MMDALQFSEIPLLAVLVATFLYFFLGALWYSPVLFGNTWADLQGIDMEGDSHQEGVWKLMAGSFVGELLIVMTLACLMQIAGVQSMGEGIVLVAMVAIGLMATTITITFLYERKPVARYLIDIGYHFVGFLIVGALFGLWS